MLRSRSPGFIAAMVLAVSLGQVAVSPITAAPVASPARTNVSVGDLQSRGSSSVRKLLATPSTTKPADRTAVDAVLARAEANIEASAASTPSRAVRPKVAPPPAPVLVTDSSDPAATIAVSAAGQTQASSGNASPAESGIAVGPDQTIESDNGSFLFDGRSAGGLLGSISTAAFFGLPEPPKASYTTFNSDPRVIFDTSRQRWIATEMSWDCVTHLYPKDPAVHGHGYIDIAISDGTDALGSWTRTFVDYADLAPIRPTFGTSNNLLGITAQFTDMVPAGGASSPDCAGGELNHAEVEAMDWSQLGPHFTPSKVWLFDGAFPGSNVRFVVPETVVADALQVIAQAGQDVEYGQISGLVVQSSILITTYDLTADGVLAGFLDAPRPSQPSARGYLTYLVDQTAQSVVSNANLIGQGELGFTENYPCVPAGDSTIHDCVRVVLLNTQTPEPSLEADVLLASKGFDDSYGAIAWDGSGLLHAVYTRSSDSSYASSYARHYDPHASNGTAWSPAQLLSSGAGTYNDTEWGEYNVVATDPQEPHAVWSGDPYAAADGTWATTIHELVVGNVGAGYHPINPIRLINFAALPANSPRSFDISGGLPMARSAVAITGNLTVTGDNAAGYLSITPTPTTTPASSTLNFPIGDTRANNVTVPLSSSGQVAIVFKTSNARASAKVILDVTGYFTLASGDSYFPLAPARILDTRKGVGASPFASGRPQPFQVWNVAGIPATATAITGNLTVADQQEAGYVSLGPNGNLLQGNSNINVPLGDVRANGFTVPINQTDGTVSALFNGHLENETANLIIDVTGYYSGAGGGLRFYPLSPGRRVDTRQTLGIDGLVNGLSGAQGTTPRSVAVTGHDAVPAGAAAITGNLTVTGQTGAGFISLTDTSVALPETSTINFPLGDTRANGITTPLGAGDLWFDYQPTAGKTVQLLLDITGYFK